jgi:hypothetical protein
MMNTSPNALGNQAETSIAVDQRPGFSDRAFEVAMDVQYSSNRLFAAFTQNDTQGSNAVWTQVAVATGLQGGDSPRWPH